MHGEAPAGNQDETGNDSVASAFCVQYTNMYCTSRETAEDGWKQVTYDELSAEEQAAVLAECERAVRNADEAMTAAMESCLGCVADCDATDSCLHGASLCPDEYTDDEEPDEEE